jgi:hypothetical protein
MGQGMAKKQAQETDELKKTKTEWKDRGRN